MNFTFLWPCIVTNFFIIKPTRCTNGAWGGVVVNALRYYSDGPGIDSRWYHWIFQWHISFRPYHGPGVDSTPSENEYQEHFLGVKAAGVWGWQPHHLHVPNVMEIWEPKPSSYPLGHTGPVSGLTKMHQFHKFILAWNSTCFVLFVCPSFIHCTLSNGICHTGL